MAKEGQAEESHKHKSLKPTQVKKFELMWEQAPNGATEMKESPQGAPTALDLLEAGGLNSPRLGVRVSTRD